MRGPEGEPRSRARTAVAVAVLAGSVLQGGVHFRSQMVKFEQFNPATALSRTFGLQALWQGAKALLKTVVVGIVLYLVLWALIPPDTIPEP